MMLEFPAGRKMGALRVSNDSSEPVTLQAQLLDWSQDGDTDLMTPTNDLIISPAVSNVPVGESQVFRILLRRPADTAERHYRIFLHALPPDPGSSNVVAIELNVALPVIVGGSPADRPGLYWSVVERKSNRIVLAARNQGVKYIRLHKVTAVASDGRKYPVRPVGNNPFVLPGVSRGWFLDLPSGVAASGHLHLAADTSEGDSSADLDIAG